MNLSRQKTAILLLIILSILVFHSFLTTNPLSSGDAPFFTQLNLKELFSLPVAWGARNENFGGFEAARLWIYPLLVLSSLFGMLNLDSTIAIRLIFYIPAVVFALFGSWLLSGVFVNQTWAKFAVAASYTINTYFLLLVDGGQIGVALAYGIFPWAVFTFFAITQNWTKAGNLLAIFVWAMLTAADLRISLLVPLVTVLIWLVKNGLKSFTKIALVILGSSVPIVLLNLYWILPLIFTNSGIPTQDVVSPAQIIASSFTKLTNSYLVLGPHWFVNEFGQTTPLLPSFLIIPVIAFWGLFYKNRQIVLLSLITITFIFLTKGANDPAGSWYLWMFNHIPGFGIFRDSTKFFVPEIIFYSLLLGVSFEQLILRKSKIIFAFATLVIVYFAGIISPVVTNQLTGNLGANVYPKSYNQTKQYQMGNDFYRLLYFPSKPSYAPESLTHPALWANSLYLLRPYSILIDGIYDKFYFLHQTFFKELLDLSGVKYIFFAPDPYRKIWTGERIYQRQQFLDFVDTLDLGSKVKFDDYPIYETQKQSPHIFAAKQAVAILGGDDFYFWISKLADFRLSNIPILFLEDGQTTLENLEKVNPDSLKLIFWSKSIQDLTFAQIPKKDLVNLADNYFSDWAHLTSKQILEWRDTASKHGLANYDFDLGRGIAWSDISAQVIKLKLNAGGSGQYQLYARVSSATDSASLSFRFDNFPPKTLTTASNNFSWYDLGGYNLAQGGHDLVIQNDGGFWAINTLVLIDKKTFSQLERQSQILTEKFKPIYLDNTYPVETVSKYINNQPFASPAYSADNPADFKIVTSGITAPYWLVFTDSYNKGWQAGYSNNTSSSLPFYSFINGFYIDKNSDSVTLYFGPQKWTNIGTGIATFTLIALVGLLLYLIRQKNK